MQLDEKEHKNDHFADDAIVYLKNKHLKKKKKNKHLLNYLVTKLLIKIKSFPINKQ